MVALKKRVAKAKKEEARFKKLDALVEEKIFSNPVKKHALLRPYSAHILFAWQIVKKLIEDSKTPLGHLAFTLYGYPDGKYYARFSSHDGATADTVEEAICLAGLAAVGHGQA